MSQLIQIRQRIKAVATIQNITHTMQLISMSTHLRLREKKAKLEDYYHTVSRIFIDIKNQVPDWQPPLLYPTMPKEQNPLLILIGSQKGLCGTFNTNLFYSFEKDLHQRAFNQVSLISVGKKTTEYVQSRLKHFPIPVTLIDSYDEFTYSNLNSLVPQLSKTILQTKNPYSTVLTYSNYPVGFFLQRQQIVKLIPFDNGPELSNNLSKEKILNRESYEWEDDPSNIIDKLSHMFLNSVIHYLLIQSLFAEQAARFISTDNATRNAKSLRESMQLQYNKLRQARITKELSELSGSFQQDLGA